MSLKSVMFAGYNKFDDAKVRIGSWREELALKELTGVTRLAEYKNKAVFNATGPRVLYHTDRSEAKDAGKSTSEVSFVDPATVAAKKDRSAYSRPGPRAIRSEQELRAIVKAEEAASASLKAEESKKGDFDTTFRQSFKRYSGEEARAAKPQSLKPGCDTPSSSSASSSQALVHDAHVGKDNASERGGVSHYTSGTTVTLWSEGGMAAKGGTAPQSSFGRTSIFTEPGVQPSFFQEVYPDPAPHHISLPEGLSDLEASTLMFLKRRVTERGQEKPLPSARGLWRLLWARTYQDAVGQIGPREFREAMAAFQVPVTQCELWAITTAFGKNGVGQISLDKFIHFMRAGGLSVSRRDLVHAAFRRLDSAESHSINGALRLKDIREACDFSSLPAVTKGKASKGEVAAMFLDHLHNNDGIRSDKDESLVTLERFQEAFLDIGTACTQHLPHSTESPPCPEAARDGRESEALFSSIAACLTG